MPPSDDHHHCKVCGAVVDPSKTVCSDACRTKRETTVNSARRLQIAMYAGAAILLLLLVVELR